MQDKFNQEDIVEVELVRQAFGSPGGKSKIVKQILPTIPKHKTYAEPFAGGAAVFWNKEKAETNILNDFDPEIAHAYKFIREITPEQINHIKEMDWNDTKEKFFFMKDKFKPKTDEEKFYKFIFTLRVSYGLARKTYGFKNITKEYMGKYLDNLPKLQEKLKGVKVYNTDYKNVLREFDSPETFFFIDPPYPEEWGFKTSAFGEREYKLMHDILKSLKGKFCLTTNIRPWITEMFKDFNMRKVLVPRSFAHNDKPDYEWFIYNYDFNDKSILMEDNIRIEVKSPDEYIRFRTIDIDKEKGIKAVIGVKEDNKSEVQSYIFNKSKWTEDRAKSWIEKHNSKEEMNEEERELSVVKRGDKWCVIHGHPQKPGSKTDEPIGSIIKCFPTKEQADAMHKAIIISQKKRGELNEEIIFTDSSGIKAKVNFANKSLQIINNQNDKISITDDDKNLIPLNVKIMKVISKNRNLYNYLVGVPANKKYLNQEYISNGFMMLGHTSNTKDKFEAEDNVVILVEDIWMHQRGGGVNYSVNRPNILGKCCKHDDLTTIKQLDDFSVSPKNLNT